MTPEAAEDWLPVVSGYGLLALIVYVVVVAPAFGVRVDPAIAAALFTLFGGLKATAAWQQQAKIETGSNIKVKPQKGSSSSDSE